MAAQIKQSNSLQEDNHDGKLPSPDDEDAIKTGTRPRGPVKPIVLSSQRYNKILNNATLADQKKSQQLEEEQRYREQLKAGNDQLVAQFSGNMQRTHEQKMQQIKDQLEKKTQQAKESYEQTKENEAQKRREKIAKSQQLIEKLKPGPRDLHTALLQSEVLRARNVQRDINEEFKKAIRKQECESKMLCQGQAMSWINEEQQRIIERQKNSNLYKQELLQSINENRKQRDEQRKQQIKEQQAAREATDLEVKAQIEKEKAIMEKKKVTLRKNALEAMKMVEQRRMRDHMSDQVEDRLCCVYNAGKHQLDTLRNEQTKKLAADHQKKIEEEVKRLSAIEDHTQAIEAERIRRDISTKQLKFTAEEQEKVRKDKAAKQARIEAYMREMQELKEAQQRADEEKRFDMALRLKNAEVNYHFVEKNKKDQLQNARDMRLFLDKQVEEVQRNKLAQQQADIICKKGNADVVEKEDKFFFEYARNLMEDAQQKRRPLYPFIKAVQQYKKENEIECERKIPRHMETHITIGRAQPTNDKAENIEKNKESNTTTQDDILQNCLKINEIIVKKDLKQNHTCVEQNENNSNQVADGCGGGSASDDKPAEKECTPSLSAKLRYSMQDLKKLNQFAAPSCH